MNDDSDCIEETECQNEKNINNWWLIDTIFYTIFSEQRK